MARGDDRRDLTLKIDVAPLQERLANLRPLLTEIGVTLTAKSQESFRKQSYGRTKWPGRMVPNVPGIVGDLNRNMRPPKRRFQPRPALVDTGKLRQSISFQVGQTDVVVGTNLEYAAQQQEGGVSKVRLLKSSRKALAELLRERPELRKDLGWLFSKPKFEVKIRPRRFVGYDNEDRATVRDLIGKHLGGTL